MPALCLLLLGCADTAVITPGTVVRLSRPASGLHVAAFDHRDASGTPVYRELAGTATFPAGTYLEVPAAAVGGAASQPSR